MARIDLNSDLGESFGAWTMGDDAAMLEIVTSANVACGFHAGDPAGILKTLREAARRGVSIGAHVAYPDLSGFGRRNMDVASADLRAGVIYQIGALQAMARVAGTQVRYVKPHGALYNTIAHDERQATDGGAGGFAAGGLGARGGVDGGGRGLCRPGLYAGRDAGVTARARCGAARCRSGG